MTDAPKRIGLVFNGLGQCRLWARDEVGMGGTNEPDAEYILAAEHERIMAEKDAEIARLKLALGEILSHDRNFYDSGRPRYEAIARAALKESPDA